MTEEPRGAKKAGGAATDEPRPDAGDDQAPTDDDSQDIERIRAERDEYLLQLQRAQAEFANYQKRMRSQAESDRAYAAGNLAADLLGALDNFELALGAARAAKADSIVDGLLMVRKQILDVLGKHGVKPIEAVGQPFDPMRHEAITQKPDPEHPEGTVVAELGKGYTLGDRVLRPSRVAVSVKP